MTYDHRLDEEYKNLMERNKILTARTRALRSNHLPKEHHMFSLIGAALVILGILGLVDVIEELGNVISILFIVGGVAIIAWAQGMFTDRR